MVAGQALLSIRLYSIWITAAPYQTEINKQLDIGVAMRSTSSSSHRALLNVDSTTEKFRTPQVCLLPCFLIPYFLIG